MRFGRGGLGTNVNLGESARSGKSPAAAALVLPSHQRFDDGALDATRPSHTAVARPRWEIRYAQAVAAADLAATAVSLGLNQWWGQTPAYDLQVVLGLVLMTLTAAVLSLTRSWDPSVLGQGSEAFYRLLHTLVTVAVVVGLVGLALKLPEVRPYVFGVIPVAFILAVAGRLVLRQFEFADDNQGCGPLFTLRQDPLEDHRRDPAAYGRGRVDDR